MPLLDRRRLAIVLAVTAAVTLVAIAARDGRHDRLSWSVPSTATGTAQAMIVLLFGVVAVGVLALTVWALLPEGHGKLEPRRRTRSIVGTVMGLVLLLSVFALRGDDNGDVELQPSAARPASNPAGAGDRDVPASPNWGLGLVGVVILLGVAGVVTLRRRPPSFDLPASRPAVATAEERVDAVAAAERCTDPRQSVLLAFAAAEALLSADPRTRRPPATSAREWAGSVRSDALSTIVGRYELARFSHHDVTVGDRRVALDALARLR